MVRPFRHPVNAADRPQGGMRVEDRITVKVGPFRLHRARFGETSPSRHSPAVQQ
jgi:hypothetical protein